MGDRWLIDRNIEHDTWGVRPSDRDRFAPGQLGIIRVGVDRRTIEERGGKPPLEAGIYALCEVESAAFSGTGANDEFWNDDAGREPGWPTVRIRYLRTYLNGPLTIARLRAEQPGIMGLLLDGFQAAWSAADVQSFDVVGSRSKRSNCASDDEADARRQKRPARSKFDGQRKDKSGFRSYRKFSDWCFRG